ncbi:MAG: hypothetical protein IPL52_06125 [Flavobacteriales bacterium]|nr:hypothetical protein [Flavobacteriales bacterium]
MTSSTPIVPVFRALTIVGTVLTTASNGETQQILVTDTTLPEEVAVVYEVRGTR